MSRSPATASCSDACLDLVMEVATARLDDVEPVAVRPRSSTSILDATRQVDACRLVRTRASSEVRDCYQQP